MRVLVCNAGSTSLKFKLYEMPQEKVLASATIERISIKNDGVFHLSIPENKLELNEKGIDIQDYKSGIKLFLSRSNTCLSSIDAIGFKPVLSRGFFSVHELDEQVIEGMKAWSDLAPIHTVAYLQSIEAMKSVLPNCSLIGCFETDFHRTINLERRLYGIPYEWYEKYHIQRLGFHGASHSYIASMLNKGKKHYKAISCHLGGSASICAIEDGRSVDTSFGMSLETGLMHANRVGDMDPTLVWYLRECGLSHGEILQGLTENGGLKGVSGVSGDLRYIIQASENQNQRAKLAIKMFINQIVRYIGAFYVELEGLDDVVFTAGIGEHSSLIRKEVCSKLQCLGISLDEEKNRANALIISDANSKVTVRVIPANEELVIARRTFDYYQRKNNEEIN